MYLKSSPLNYLLSRTLQRIITGPVCFCLQFLFFFCFFLDVCYEKMAKYLGISPYIINTHAGRHVQISILNNRTSGPNSQTKGEF